MIDNSPLVSARAARGALRRAQDLGARYYEVAELAGISPHVVSGIAVNKNKRTSEDKSAAIIAACEQWTDNRDEVRNHLFALTSAGYRVIDIAPIVGVNRSVLERLRSDEGGPKAVHPTLSRKILAIPARVDRRIATALGAERRLQALIAWGYWVDQLAEELDITKDDVWAIVTGKHDESDVYLGQRITETFSRLEQKRGPSDYARLYGLGMNWLIPFQWDEYTIDKPKSHTVDKCDGWDKDPVFVPAEGEDELAKRRARVAAEIETLVKASA